jgi:DNA excision repair protein ERCC-2
VLAFYHQHGPNLLCCLSYSDDSQTLALQQFLRRMAQPYDKAGSGGKKTLLTEEDLENLAQDGMAM